MRLQHASQDLYLGNEQEEYDVPSRNQRLGDRGEQIAEGFLQDLGYTILKRKYRFHRHEVDLICVAPGFSPHTIVFVEVKARSSVRFGYPESSVIHGKQRRIAGVARAYISLHKHYNAVARFDVISIDLSRSVPRVLHLKDAFRI